MARDSMLMYRSFYSAMSELPGEQYKRLSIAISEYALDGKEPELTGVEHALFILIKPQLDANDARYQNSLKGVRKKQEPKQKTNDKNQDKTKDEPNDNQNQTASETNDNVSDNDSVNDNVSDNGNGNAPPFLSEWYKKHQAATTLMLRPSVDDMAAAKEAHRQLNYDDDLASKCVVYYWDNWCDLWFAVKKRTKDFAPMMREPDYSFQSFARNITSCIPK